MGLAIRIWEALDTLFFSWTDTPAFAAIHGNRRTIRIYRYERSFSIYLDFLFCFRTMIC